MKKSSLSIAVLVMILCLLLPGMAVNQANGGEAMPVYTYTTQEIWVQNGDFSIYGIAYVPETEGKVPLVIFSHELGNDHTSGERYAQRLAAA